MGESIFHWLFVLTVLVVIVGLAVVGIYYLVRLVKKATR
jgi:flagellar biogenesis protein FliO